MAYVTIEMDDEVMDRLEHRVAELNTKRQPKKPYTVEEFMLICATNALDKRDAERERYPAG